MECFMDRASILDYLWKVFPIQLVRNWALSTWEFISMMESLLDVSFLNFSLIPCLRFWLLYSRELDDMTLFFGETPLTSRKLVILIAFC